MLSHNSKALWAVLFFSIKSKVPIPSMTELTTIKKIMKGSMSFSNFPKRVSTGFDLELERSVVAPKSSCCEGDELAPSSPGNGIISMLQLIKRRGDSSGLSLNLTQLSSDSEYPREDGTESL